MRFPALLATMCLAVCGQLGIAGVWQAQGNTNSDVWYTCTLGGQLCGWMEVTTAKDSEKRTIETHLVISLRRLNSSVKSRIDSTLVESLDGEVQEFIFAQHLGDDVIEERWFFLSDRIRYIVKNGNRQRTATKLIPKGEWFSTEEAMRRAITESTSSNGFSTDEPVFTARVLDPSLGENPVPTRFYREGVESIEAPGGTVESTRWRVEHQGSPPIVIWLDGEGEMVRSQSEFGGGVGALEMTRSTRANALKSFPAPEIMLKTSVEPTLAQGVSRSLDRAKQIKLRVRTRNGAMVSLPSIGAQQIDEEGLILIDIAETSPKEDGVEGDFLASVPMADTTDEEIIAFAKAGVGHRVGEASRAKALRQAVNRHINLKNLSTAFASASETVRKKTGDCTEHAVLLIAALRAQGIPARAVNGLIWTRNPGAGVSPAYVWHMWTQALIDEEWVDLDATLVGPRGFHTGHLAVSVNDLSRASINKAATQMLEILGDLEIEVLQVETGR